MQKQKTFFIIPGFQTQASDEEYSWLVRLLQDNNYLVRCVPILWSRRTVTQNAEEFLQYFEIHKTDENYILGFSYGAVIAFITAEKTNPNKLFLCSLSPDFSEDSESMPIVIRNYIGVRRYLDTKTRSARAIVKKLKTPTVIFYGEKEGAMYPPLKKRAEETAKYSPHTKLVVVPDAPHEIDFPSYQTAVKSELVK